MSSISDSWYGFAQNEKTVEGYAETVNNDIIPIFRGHLLTETDLIIRKHILNLMCNLETEWSLGLPLLIKKEIIGRLQEMVADQLIEITDNKVIVKEEGRMYVRNICMAFDLKLIENKPNTRLFSMTI